MNSPHLKILQICSAREAIYGAVQSLLALAKQQRSAGHHVEFLTFRGKKFGQQVGDLGFPVHEVQVRSKIDPVAIFQMRSIIRRGRYDIVHTHLSTSSVNGTLAARFAGTPSVATVHGMSGKLSFIAANRLIAVSNQVKVHLVQQGLRSENISVVYNGMAICETLSGETATTRAQVREKFHLSGQPVIGTVSRITALKGIEDAIQAVSLLVPEFPELQYLVVGDGDGLERSKALAAQLGIESRVRFVGYQTDVSGCLTAMDLFLFPSHKEAMGIALVEAMACSLPIVSTNVGGIPEVLEESGGRLVAPRSPEALARETSLLLGDPAKMRAMGEQNFARAKTVFSVEAMEKNTLDVYKTLVR